MRLDPMCSAKRTDVRELALQKLPQNKGLINPSVVKKITFSIRQLQNTFSASKVQQQSVGQVLGSTLLPDKTYCCVASSYIPYLYCGTCSGLQKFAVTACYGMR